MATLTTPIAKLYALFWVIAFQPDSFRRLTSRSSSPSPESLRCRR